GRVSGAHEGRGAGGTYDAVVVGLYREFDYDVLSACMRAVRAGARLIGSNADNSYPTPDGPVPGGGAVLAAVAVAAGVEPIITGKPHGPMIDLVRARLAGTEPGRMVVIGDKVQTDGLLARELGSRFGFVLSGVGDAAEAPAGSIVGDDLSSVVDLLLG
ncbi:MAG: HAD hydrolase-like protein, partial [Ilumatobacteraceae bacterium]